MKGIVFNILEDFICQGWGEDVYEEILGQCPLHTKEPFVGPHTYPDADMFMIVGRAAEKLGISVPEAAQAFGKFCFPKLAGKYPVFLQGHEHPKSFLKSIDGVIHVEVRKLLRDADPPRITFVDPGRPDELILNYASKRNLCPLMSGLLDGVSEHFRTPIHYRQVRCTQHGASACEYHLTFGQPRAVPV